MGDLTSKNGKAKGRQCTRDKQKSETKNTMVEKNVFEETKRFWEEKKLRELSMKRSKFILVNYMLFFPFPLVVVALVVAAVRVCLVFTPTPGRTQVTQLKKIDGWIDGSTVDCLLSLGKRGTVCSAQSEDEESVSSSRQLVLSGFAVFF